MSDVIVTLPELGLSRSAAMRSKHWIKRLDRVNTDAKDGYAFEGPFEKFDATVEVPDGTWYLVFREDRTASRLRGIDVWLYRAQGDKVAKVKYWELDGSPGWALKVRDEIAAMVNVPDAVEDQAEDVAPAAGGGEVTLTLRLIPALAQHLYTSAMATFLREQFDRFEAVTPGVDLLDERWSAGSMRWCENAASALMLIAYEQGCGFEAALLWDTGVATNEGDDPYVVLTTRPMERA